MFRKVFKKDEFMLLWPFYLATFLDCSFSVLSAYFILYFLSIGFSVSQIAYLESAYFFSIFFFDILTGAVADIYGRKFSVIISGILTGLLSLIIPFLRDFYKLLTIYLIWGVVRTLATGSDQAWVVSNLNFKKKSELIKRYYSKNASIANLGGLISSLIAVFIVTKFGMKFLWSFQGIGLIITSLTLLVPKEHFKSRKVKIKDSYKELWNQTKESISYGLHHKVIFNILFASFFFVFVINSLVILWPPYLKGFDLPLSYFGYILSVSYALGIVVPIISEKIGNKFLNKSRYLSLLIFIAFVGLVLSFFAKDYVIGITALMIVFTMYDSFTPIELPFFQQFLPNKMRATISSFKSTMMNLGGGLSMLAVGLISSFASPKTSLLMLSLFLIPSTYFYMKIKNHGY